MTMESMKMQLKHFYPKAKQNKDVHFNAFKKTFELPPTEKVEKLSPECFTGPEKFLCINSGMGSGKTSQTIDYLKERNFIWIAPIIALARNLKSLIKATYYKDVEDKTKMDARRLLICMNSLHYVERIFRYGRH